MNPVVNEHYNRIFAWAERNPQAKSVPHHIQASIDLINRYDQATKQKVINLLSQCELYEFEDRMNDIAGDYQKRRELENELADYIADVAAVANRPDLFSISDRLANCRKTGTVGVKPDGGHIIAWDAKCGLVRLCPDESREETQRIDKFYRPEILNFKTKTYSHRLFYAVFTAENYAPGELLKGKKELFEKYKEFIKQTNQDKDNKKILSSLVIQEDPLSAGLDWNVHLNALLLVNGEFDYQAMRERWGGNVHFQEIKQENDKPLEKTISNSIRELIKYSSLIVSEKSQAKAGDKQESLFDDSPGFNGAPGMLDWPTERFLEWWDAQQGFRRTRSYGELYALHGKRWNAMNENERLEVCVNADLPIGIHGRMLARCTWKEILADHPKKEKEKIKVKLRKAMIHGERLDLLNVQWLGVMKWDGTSYKVDLIQGDNFSRKIVQNDNLNQAQTYTHDPGG